MAEAYCVKDKKKVEVVNPQRITMKNGKPALQGTCPVCGGKVFKIGRSTVFGIPVQQQWAYGSTGDYAPTYYLQTDAPLYYYSFTDAWIAGSRRWAWRLP